MHMLLCFSLILGSSPSAQINRNPQPTIARPRTTVPTTKDEAYEFAKAFISSLGWSQQALSRIPHLEPNPTGNAAQLVEKVTASMLGIKLAVESWKRAGAEVNKFTQSKTEGVRVTATSALSAYTALGQLYQQLNAEIQNDLDLNSKDPLGSRLNRRADLMVKIDKALDLLDQTAVGATYAIIETPQGKDEQLSFLALSAEQRNEISEMMFHQFGNSIKNLRGDEDRVTVAAYLFYKVLGNPQWKTRR